MSAPPPRYEASFSPRGLPSLLFVVAFVLLACHATLSIIHYEVVELPWLLRQLFDLDEENNLPTWYSGFLLLVASVFLWLCARSKRADGDPWFGQWYALATGFLLLSIDEVAGLHETINSIIEISWAIPAGVLAVMIGLGFAPFLISLPRRTARLFLLSGAVYLTGAVGIEITGIELGDTLSYAMATLAEEGLEMFGVLLFLHALLAYMRGAETGSVQASLEVGPT